MTRLNSTFRSGCKLNNRTIKQEKQAGQAHKLRSYSRVLSRRNRVFIDIDKTLVRTCKLFRTTLHERLKRTSRATSVKAIRAMDVARQSSMEEGLQVQLLSWKENPDNLISDKLKERCGFDDDMVLSRVSEDRQSSNGVENDAQAKFCSQQDEETLGKLNGVGKIEACVRSENRMQDNAKPAEKTLNDLGCIPHTEHTGDDRIIHRNGIASDDLHLGSSIDLQESVPSTINEAENLNSILSASSKVEHSGICLKDVQSTFTSRPSHSPLADTKDGCILNVEENRTTMEDTDVKTVPTNSEFKDNDRVLQLQRYKGMQRVETNLLDNTSRLISQASDVDIDSVHGPAMQADVNVESVTTNECKNESTNEGQNCLCEGIDGVASLTSAGTTEGRPKRTTRRLRPRHEDDYILDVRQIPHKFNDKISTVKKGNRKTLLPGCKRRRKTMKQSSCDDVQGVMDVSEKVNTRVNDGDEEKYSNVDCVLGVRHDDCNKQQVLVQFTDGTSNWIKKSEVRSPVDFLCEYFSHPDQDIVAAQRLPAQWFGYELASWEDRALEEADFGEFDFFEKDDKVSRDCRTRKGYSSGKQSNRSSQNLISVTHEFSNSPKDLTNSCKYVVEDGDRMITHTDDEIYSAQLFSSEINENSSLDKYPSIPLALDSLTKNGECSIGDLDYMFIDTDLTESELIGSKVAEENPHLLKRLPYGDRTISSSPDAIPIFVSRNGELEVLQSDHIEIILKHKDKRSKRIRSETCDNLIHQLESRINDDKCQFVVINGLEDYFASSMDMEKLIKFPCEAEKTRYDEKMANLRYVFY